MWISSSCSTTIIAYGFRVRKLALPTKQFIHNPHIQYIYRIYTNQFRVFFSKALRSPPHTVRRSASYTAIKPSADAIKIQIISKKVFILSSLNSSRTTNQYMLVIPLLSLITLFFLSLSSY